MDAPERVDLGDRGEGTIHAGRSYALGPCGVLVRFDVIDRERRERLGRFRALAREKRAAGTG